VALKDVALRLHAGEILGIGGVAGNGQEELLSALSGEIATAPGTVMLEGADLSALGPPRRAAAQAFLSAPRTGWAMPPSPNSA
jgi:ABC-type uncharacterized transport system ATPase subunit